MTDATAAAAAAAAAGGSGGVKATLSNILESRCITAIVVAAVAVLGIGIAAVATPHWHETDSAVQHVRRGLFQACSVESVDGSLNYKCDLHDLSGVCGHSSVDTANRLVWPVVFAMASLATLLLIPLGATVSWCIFSPRPKTLFALCTLSLACMLIAVSIFVHTMDGWYFCGMEFCDYTKSRLLNSGDGVCLSGLGYSFVLAMVYCGGLVLLMTISAVYARWVRVGAIEDLDETRRLAKNAVPTVTAPTEPTADVEGTNDAAVNDWEYDEGSQLLFSAHHQLFLEPDSGRFYDPHTDSWYNPTTKEWQPQAQAQ